MTDRLREAAQAALDDLEARCGTHAIEQKLKEKNA